MHSLKAFPFQVQVWKKKTTADFQRRARRIIKVLNSKVEKHMQLSKQQCPGIPFLHNTFVLYKNTFFWQLQPFTVFLLSKENSQWESLNN